MAGASERLLQLRPVKFRYKKADASGDKPIQYGLIAEEVAKVYPELAVRDAATGRLDGVRYDELAPMLLNEMQQQQQKIATQDVKIRGLEQQHKQFAAQSQQLRKVQRQLAVLQAEFANLQAKDDLVAHR
jgi:hypothetical protein